jgi:hypothetical protein
VQDVAQASRVLSINQTFPVAFLYCSSESNKSISFV